MDLITVIIPAYNVEKTIHRCLDSLITQTYKELEIIIINDGSIDNTGGICDQYSIIDDRIRVFHQENMGVAKARNRGIEAAQGKFLSFIDADDFVESNMFETLIAAFKKSKENDLVVCGYDKYDKENRIEEKIYCKEYMSQIQFMRYLFDPYSIKGFLVNKLFRTEIIKTNQLQLDSDIYMCEDLLFCCRYCQFIQKVQFVEGSFYHYVMNDDGATHSEYSSKRFTAMYGFQRMEKIVVKFDDKKLKALFDAHYIIICIQLFKRLLKKYKRLSVDEIREVLLVLKRKNMHFLFSNWPVKYKIVYVPLKLLSVLII